MFFRTVLTELKKWSEKPDRKPLILRGARQVGKTTAVDIFAQEFNQYIYLNLEKPEDAHFFTENMPVEELIAAIFFSQNMEQGKGKSLLFIDEIQNSPEAVKMMRYFYESAKDLHVIAAGSLLETLIGRNISFPVGRVEYLFMNPLTFEEYLNATGEHEALKLLKEVPFPAYAHERMLKLFHIYTLIGGMPEIIKKYIERKDIVTLNPIFKNLLITYMDDVEKYARNDTVAKILRHAIQAAPYEAGKRIKFQGFGSSSYGSREMGEALKTLEKAMLITLIYPTTSIDPPLIPDYRKSPRLQFLDTGLINYFVGLQEYYFNLNDLSSFYQGILAEHIVGQELQAAFSRQLRNLSFWVREKKQSNAEVDFILPFKKYLIPIEVKSGKTGTLRSLHQFVNRVEHQYAVRLYSGRPEKTETVTPEKKKYTLLNLPYYLACNINAHLEWLVED